jgi:hypothetical protein
VMLCAQIPTGERGKERLSRDDDDYELEQFG